MDDKDIIEAHRELLWGLDDYEGGDGYCRALASQQGQRLLYEIQQVRACRVPLEMQQIHSRTNSIGNMLCYGSEGMLLMVVQQKKASMLEGSLVRYRRRDKQQYEAHFVASASGTDEDPYVVKVWCYVMKVPIVR